MTLAQLAKSRSTQTHQNYGASATTAIVSFGVGLAFGILLVVGCSSSDSDSRLTAAPQGGASSLKDATYLIEGRAITLVNGVSELEAAPGSAAKITTRYFGNEAAGDLEGDGALDVGFVLTQSSGGSGTFYYVVVALQTKAGFIGTNAILLGDRIAPQTTEFRSGELIVNYAIRKEGEPMTTPPSLGVSKYLKIVAGKLVER